jgi:hypothetical protein
MQRKGPYSWNETKPYAPRQSEGGLLKGIGRLAAARLCARLLRYKQLRALGPLYSSYSPMWDGIVAQVVP